MARDDRDDDQRDPAHSNQMPERRPYGGDEAHHCQRVRLTSRNGRRGCGRYRGGRRYLLADDPRRGRRRSWSGGRRWQLARWCAHDVVSLLGKRDWRWRRRRGGAGVGGGEGEYEDEERDVGEYEQEEEPDRDVTGDQAGQRKAFAGFTRSLDLAPGNVAGDHGDDSPEAPGAQDGRGRERRADDRPRVVRARYMGGRRWRRLGWQRRGRLHPPSVVAPT